MNRFFAGSLPRRFGHRGASGTHPENTLESFTAAVERGADAFELDVHRTRDGEIVVFHDDTLERTTDGRGPIAARTLAEIRELDAGFGFSPDGGRGYPFRGKGVVVPTLREVTEGFPDVPLIIEIKQASPPLEEDLAQVLQSTGADERALVFSLHQEPVDRFRRAREGWITGFGPVEVAEFLRRVNAGDWAGYRPQGAAFAVPVQWHGTRIVSAPFVEAAHRLGIEVYVWTVNEPGEMHALLDLGVDGLISDFPERIGGVVAERGTRSGGTT